MQQKLPSRTAGLTRRSHASHLAHPLVNRPVLHFNAIIASAFNPLLAAPLITVY